MKQFLKNIAEDMVSLSAYWVFLLLCVFHAIALYFQQQLILTDEVYYNSLGEQLTYERIEILLNAQKSKVGMTVNGVLLLGSAIITGFNLVNC